MKNHIPEEGGRPHISKYFSLDPIRKGVPNEFRKDIYYYFLKASWFKTFSALFFLYILSNIVFACLYMVVPGSISDKESIGFLDAFFFSVQTMSTIGYGELHPNNLYSNFVVTLEAAYGLISVALVTGLLFSRFSKPKAKILFSKQMIVANFEGEKCLSFRMGNVRGNDIVEAKISLAALIDEVTSEGQQIRRVYDLKLKRSETPFFKLTWSIYHPLDSESPLKDILFKQQNLIGIACTVMGHDGSYSNTVYDRHSYSPADIVKDRYFVDIMSFLPNGQVEIDYARFHDLKEPI